MSALIKSGRLNDARSFALLREPATPAGIKPDPRDAERAALAAEVERLTLMLRDLEATSLQALAEAREEGRREASAQAAEREEDRLALLSGAMTEAGSALSVQLDLLDRLAPTLARAALGKIFDSCEAWDVPVQAMLARQLSALRRSSVVAIRVSPQDFPDAKALEALATNHVRAEIDAELRAGACRIECALGQIDLDARIQWAALAALLDEMSQ
jgi:flagellar assembly protein FliH